MGNNLLINGLYWGYNGYNPLILTFYQNFLGHPSIPKLASIFDDFSCASTDGVVGLGWNPLSRKEWLACDFEAGAGLRSWKETKHMSFFWKKKGSPLTVVRLFFGGWNQILSSYIGIIRNLRIFGRTNQDFMESRRVFSHVENDMAMEVEPKKWSVVKVDGCKRWNCKDRKVSWECKVSPPMPTPPRNSRPY